MSGVHDRRIFLKTAASAAGIAMLGSRQPLAAAVRDAAAALRGAGCCALLPRERDL